MDAVGNNIANSSTTGYKSERAMFADAFYQLLNPASAPTATLGGIDPSALGHGVPEPPGRAEYDQHRRTVCLELAARRWKIEQRARSPGARDPQTSVGAERVQRIIERGYDSQ